MIRARIRQRDVMPGACLIDVRLVRVEAEHFVAGFETDGTVCRTAPILKRLQGLSDDEARAVIERNGWTAKMVTVRSKTDRVINPVIGKTETT